MTITADLEIFINLLTALAIGLLIGIERGFQGKHEEEGDRVAGIRTFSLIGLLGGISALLSSTFGEWIVGVVFLAVTAISIAAYMLEYRRNADLGTTTVYATLLTFSLGAWAAFGFYVYALSAAVIVVTVLSLKPVLHGWLRGIETREIYAGIKMLLISVVLLPLLPNQGFGPWEAINPRWIWYMVVLISGISFVGYFMIKYAGDRVGTLLTALTGGLASSTAVTLNMANLARTQGVRTIFMAGVMLASSIMFIRITVEVMVVNPVLMRTLWPPLLVMFLGVVGGGIWLWTTRIKVDEEHHLELTNPLKITMALKFGLLLGVILFMSTAMKELFGDAGIYVLAVISGMMDVDAITLSLSRLSRDEIAEEVAVIGIMLAAVTNTMVKGAMFAFFAGFRKSLKLLGLMLSAGLLGLITAFLTIF